MRERVVLIGAGSAMFTRGLVADLLRSGAEVDLALVDVDPVALDIVTKLASKMIAAGPDCPVRVGGPARGPAGRYRRHLHHRGRRPPRLGARRVCAASVRHL
jgi:Family 4 glycosyl hydrolase